MATKRPKPEEIVAKFRQVGGLKGQGLMGQAVPRIDAIRRIRAIEQTCHRPLSSMLRVACRSRGKRSTRHGL